MRFMIQNSPILQMGIFKLLNWPMQNIIRLKTPFLLVFIAMFCNVY